MPHAEHTVTIGRPVEEVFAFVADGENCPKWRPGVLDIQRVSGQGLGETYRQGVRGPGGRRIAADYRVTVYEPGRRLAFETTAGPVRPRGEYRFEQSDGGTRLTFALDAELSGLRKVMSSMVTKTMQAEVAAIDNVKSLLES